MVENLHREVYQKLVCGVGGSLGRALDAPPLLGKDADALVQGAVG